MGTSVLLKGRRGSGRTGAVKRIVTDLERIGLHVLYGSGHRATMNQPYAALVSQGFSFAKHSIERAPLQVADFVAQQITTFESTAVVFDDVDLIDPESLEVFDLVLRRTKNPWLITRSSRYVDDAKVSGLLDRWPVASLTLPTLRHSEVTAILRERLGGPIDPVLVTLVMTESAGIPQLASAICDSLVFASRLQRSDGLFRLSGAPTVWNEHLEPVAESWLTGLTSDERNALEILSLVGIQPIRAVRDIVNDSVLQDLDRKGLLSFLGENGAQHVAVDPPLIGEYFRHGGRSSPLVAFRVKAGLDEAAWLRPTTGVSAERLEFRASARAQLNAETDREDSVLSKYFLDQVRLSARVTFERWRTSPSADTAHDFLDVALGQAVEQARVAEVFAATPIAAASQHSFAELRFVSRHAQWLAFQNDDLDGALEVLGSFAEEAPDWRAEITALRLLVSLTTHGVPADFEQSLDAIPSQHAECGVVTTVRAFLLICSGRASEALTLLGRLPDLDERGRLIPFVRGLALFFSGRQEAALAYALDGRARARQSLDSHGLAAHTYVAMLAMLYSGLWDEGERIASNLHTLTSPGGFMSLVFDATYRLSALVQVVEGRYDKNVSHSVPRGSDFGPLLGFGTGVMDITSGEGGKPEDPVPRLIDLMRRQSESGFVAGATYAGILGLCLYAEQPILDALLNTMTEEDAARHSQLTRLAAAVVAADANAIVSAIDDYQRDVDTFMGGLLLKVATARNHTSVGRQRWADTFLRFHDRFPEFVEPPTDTELNRLRVNLTERERDVALLGGSLTNQQIATRLGISVRTVENHIANAMRKVGSESRSSLFRVVYQNHTIVGDRTEPVGGRRLS